MLVRMQWDVSNFYHQVMNSSINRSVSEVVAIVLKGNHQKLNSGKNYIPLFLDPY